MTAIAAATSIAVRAVTVTHRRGGEVVTALDDVGLDLEAGRLTAVVGPSGSGKTTLLHLLVGAGAPDRGTITGLPATRDWASIALVPQTLGLLEELSLAENVGLPGRLGIPLPREPGALMAELGIDHLARRLPVETSLGEQQRAAVARALVAEPRLVMADEPTSHQDEPNAMRVLDVLERTAAAGGMVVLATHDPRIVERCHHVVALRDGRVVADELGRV